MAILAAFVVYLLIGAVASFPFQSRVVNGTNAEEGEFPFMVSLRSRIGAHFCGGSLIAPDWVLTAAHCVYGDKPQDVSVQYGVTKIAIFGPNVVTVKKIIVHEGYKGSGNYPNDVALLQLTDPVKFDYKTVGPALLPVYDSELPPDVEATLAGWGLDRSGGSIQYDLQKVTLKVYTDEECNRRHDGMTTIDHICGGVDEGGKGQCSGDSGGPLIYDGHVQIGIVSWSVKPCTVAPYPGVYTKVSHYAKWIVVNMSFP